MPWAMAKTPVVTPNFDCSWLKIDASMGLPPRPPNTFGHAIPAQPPSCRVRCQRWQLAVCTASGTDSSAWPSEKSSGWPFGTACAWSQARASARNSASAGVSSKSTPLD